MVACCAAIMLVVFLAAGAAITTDDLLKQASNPFDYLYRPNSPDVSLDALQPPDLHIPHQIHINYLSPSSVVLTWATGVGEVGNFKTPRAAQGLGFLVAYGTTSANLTITDANAVAYNTYLYSYNVPTASGTIYPNYSSPTIARQTLSNLAPRTTYYYTITNQTHSTNKRNFTTLPQAGDKSNLKLAFVADLGQTYNSSDTLHHMEVEEGLDAVFLIGDLTYADNYAPDGDPDWGGMPPGVISTYQPKWDAWGVLTEPLFSHIPLLANNGNHEIETQADNNTFVSYRARHPNPASDTSAKGMWYSTDLGLVHAVFITSYGPFHVGSEQYKWLVNDLSGISRDVTPWVVVTVHAPWYSSYVAHYQENECMRQAVEPLLYAHAVDLFVSGHVHAYERTHPVYDYSIDPCGPVHLVIGDGGNVEGMSVDFADTDGNCPDVLKDPVHYQPQKCIHLTPDGQYCDSKQPSYSAFREPSFGYGTLHVHNTTTATWRWHRNQDTDRIVADEVTFKRSDIETDDCSMRRSYALQRTAAQDMLAEMDMRK